MCKSRDLRSARSSGFIQRALAQLENFQEVWIAYGLPLDEIGVSFEQILQLVQQAKVDIAQAGSRLRLKLHHEIDVTSRRIERPLRGRAEYGQALDVVLHAQLADGVEVIGDRRR